MGGGIEKGLTQAVWCIILTMHERFFDAIDLWCESNIKGGFLGPSLPRRSQCSLMKGWVSVVVEGSVPPKLINLSQ